MKTINIAPTWLWCAQVYRVASESKSKKAADGFRKELNRLGPAVRELTKQIESGIKTKDAHYFLQQYCIKIDKAIAAKTEKRKG